MTYNRVGVIMGGSSSEAAVSIRSGEAVAQALESRGYAVTRVALDAKTDAYSAIKKAPMDAAFLALHGRHGEDGCVQGVLELLGIPYTGSSVLGSALSLDKLKSKELFRLHNVPTPPYYVFDPSKSLDRLVDVHGSFGCPVVVKPRREGSSIGVARAGSLEELRWAVSDALRYDVSVLVERYVRGREIAVGFLDGRVLGAAEIEPAGPVYDFRAKYASSETRYHLPARLQSARFSGVLNLAERAVEALDVTGAARVDLLVTEGQNEYVLEVNTLPGMTETSLLPKIARAAGYGFSDLCEAILSRARLHCGTPEGIWEPQAEPTFEEPAFEPVEAPAEPAVANRARGTVYQARRGASKASA